MNVPKKEMDAIVQRVGDKTTAKKPPKTKHTKEPWAAHLNAPAATIPGHIIKAAYSPYHPIASLWEGGGTHGKPEQMANTERIVACINGCAGINPKAVPKMLAALELLAAHTGPVTISLGCVWLDDVTFVPIRELIKAAKPEPRT